MDELIDQYIKVPVAQRMMGGIAVLIGILFAHYFFIYEGQKQELITMESKLRKAQTDERETRSVADNLSIYEAKLGDLKAQLEDARTKLPDTADVPQLLAQISNRGRKIGLFVDAFEPMAEKLKGFYAEIGFKMKVRGSFHEVVMFIDAMGNMDRIINVKNIKMGNPKSENAKIMVAATFNVVTYRFADKGKK